MLPVKNMIAVRSIAIAVLAATLLSSCGAITKVTPTKVEDGPEQRAELEKLEKQGLELMVSEHYAEAEPVLKRREELWTSIYGKNDALMSDVPSAIQKNMNNGLPDPPNFDQLAECYEAQGKFAVAEPLRRTILQAHQQTGQQKDQLQTNYWPQADKLAANLAAQKKYDEAVQLYKKSIDMKTAQLRPEQFPRAGAYESMKFDMSADEYAALAKIYRQQGRTDEATALEKQLQKAHH